MDKNIINIDNKIYSNNNNILLQIINELKQIIDVSNDNLIIKKISDIIIKMNYIINDNKKNTELIRNDILRLYNHINKQFEELKNNTINHQEINYNFNHKNSSNKRIRYVGQVLKGLPEGKGTMYWENGDRYEGDYKIGKKEGKGIYYYINGDRYEGDFKNNRYDGKGIFYYNNGDRKIGDYSKGEPIGKHVILKKNGEIETKNY